MKEYSTPKQSIEIKELLTSLVTNPSEFWAKEIADFPYSSTQLIAFFPKTDNEGQEMEIKISVNKESRNWDVRWGTLISENKDLPVALATLLIEALQYHKARQAPATP